MLVVTFWQHQNAAKIITHSTKRNENLDFVFVSGHQACQEKEILPPWSWFDFHALVLQLLVSSKWKYLPLAF